MTCLLFFEALHAFLLRQVNWRKASLWQSSSQCLQESPARGIWDLDVALHRLQKPSMQLWDGLRALQTGRVQFRHWAGGKVLKVSQSFRGKMRLLRK